MESKQDKAYTSLMKYSKTALIKAVAYICWTELDKITVRAAAEDRKEQYDDINNEMRCLKEEMQDADAVAYKNLFKRFEKLYWKREMLR